MVASDEEQEELEEGQEEQRRGAEEDGRRLKHVFHQEQEPEVRSPRGRKTSKQGPRSSAEEGHGETVLRQLRHFVRETPHREWWNFLYRKDFAMEVAWRRVLQHRWLFTMKHVLLQHLSFLAFVVLSANDNIIKAQSKRHLDGVFMPRDFPYAFSSVLFIASLMSVLGGSVLALCLDGWPALCKCWNIWSILNMSPASMLFQFGTLLKFMSLKYLPPDMVSMLSQMNLVMLAIALRLLMGKRYRKSQWIALAMTSLAMLQYTTVRDAHHKGGMNESPTQLSANVMAGGLIIITMCMAETLASVLAEKQFKERQEAFYVLKVHADLCGLVFAALWCYVLEPFVLKDLGWSCKPERCRQVIDQGLFSGWDQWTILVLVTIVCKMWLAGLVARVLDSVVKQLGSCSATVLTYFEVVWLYPEENIPDFATLVALAVVMMAIASFAVSTRDSLTIERLKASHSLECDASWTQNYQKAPGA